MAVTTYKFRNCSFFDSDSFTDKKDNIQYQIIFSVWTESQSFLPLISFSKVANLVLQKFKYMYT